ncbi:MAG: squalene cyclase [Acidimicrobiia bacterium]
MEWMDTVHQWLLEGDPSIRWQVIRDLLGRPESEWAAERAKIESAGWGASLLAHQDKDGQWAGGAYNPADRDRKEVGQPWTATTHTLSQLRTFGLDPTSKSASRTVELLRVHSHWEEGNQPYWEGEVEPCINGITVANGAYFGVDTAPIVERLTSETLPDGGWNCEAVNGSIRTSFDTTINVLEGLIEYEKATGGTPASIAARKAAEDFLLERELFKRLSTGEPADDDYLLLRNPVRWQYDILRGLDYFQNVGDFEGSDPDSRLGAAFEHLEAKRQGDGRWLLDKNPRGRVWFDVDDGPGLPSRWITLRALRVLEWAGR